MLEAGAGRGAFHQPFQEISVLMVKIKFFRVNTNFPPNQFFQCCWEICGVSFEEMS